MSIETAWLLYQELRFPRLSKKTRDEYCGVMRRVALALPNEPGLIEVQRWLLSMRGEGLRPSTCNMYLSVLRAVSRHFATLTGQRGLIAAVEPCRPFRTGPRAPRCPPDDLLDRCLEVARNPGERAFLMLAGLAGLRVGEILGLQPGDWNPTTRVVQVVRQRGKPTRKNRKEHSVVIDDPELLRCWLWTLENRAALRSRTGWFRGSSDGHVFPWSKRRLEGILARLRGHFGDDWQEYLPSKTAWHAFRHWGATQRAKRGDSAWKVQQWLGDSSTEVAARYVSFVRGVTRAEVVGEGLDGVSAKPPAYRDQECSALRAPKRPKQVGLPELTLGQTVTNNTHAGVKLVWEKEKSA